MYSDTFGSGPPSFHHPQTCILAAEKNIPQLQIKYMTNSHVFWFFFIPYKYKSNCQDF